MIQITAEQVNDYLELIHDQNPVHQRIVPGQMIVQLALTNKKLAWTSYKVKYVASVEINETLDIEPVTNEKVVVSNQSGDVKIFIFKI
ncbi:hypothetical protein M4L39_05500 [Staphylococcus equorum]|uniref:Uncharacterized protein n=1 Tax=Staphylococcus equorum TaxID=246432 RepID=A0A9X4LB88_9STAP|nr:hypothetical protein [Staphylococcus equorum]MDG0842891.1 hypothetical protein [Staphylococcus equorum]MDG0859487.1 hypothetical protein [Staphylococcus equorum]